MLRTQITAAKKTCPFCKMMDRAVKNAIIGMGLSGSVLAAVIYGYQSGAIF